MKSCANILSVMCYFVLAITSNNASAVTDTSSLTYTFLRCFYKTDQSNLNMSVDWRYATDQDDFYRIYGRWLAGSGHFLKTFYTSTHQEQLLSVCTNTLKKAGILAPVVKYAAADNNKLPYYRIWTNYPAENEPARYINRIVSFGDSVSDTDNLLGITGRLPNVWNYFFGRFSNGINWLDYLSIKLNLPINNWSVGNILPQNSFLGLPEGVETQVASWRAITEGNYSAFRPEYTLFTMSTGMDDLITDNLPVETIISKERLALEALIKNKAKNILLVNLPDLSLAPLFKIEAGKRDFIRTQVIKFNVELNNLAKSLSNEHRDVNIKVFNAFYLVNKISQSKADYHIKDAENSCLMIDSSSYTNYFSALSPRPECNDADSFLFWDLVHLTSGTQKLVADEIFHFIHAEYPLINTDTLQNGID